MQRSATPPPSPVTADDVTLAARLSVDALSGLHPAAWQQLAGSLEWDRWETVEHLSDALFAYATQLGPRQPPLEANLPFVRDSRRPGGPRTRYRTNRAAGPSGLLQVLETTGALLTAMVRTASPQVRAYHVYGVSDPEGFAAMGVVETLVHTHDIVQGQDADWAPPADLCSRALARLFPDAPAGHDPWLTLLWATGRAELPGHARRSTWRWHGTPKGHS
ncbi:hypothetical protein [Streptomyces sparsus]